MMSTAELRRAFVRRFARFIVSLLLSSLLLLLALSVAVLMLVPFEGGAGSEKSVNQERSMEELAVEIISPFSSWSILSIRSLSICADAFDMC